MSSQRSNSMSQPNDEHFRINKHNFDDSLPRLKTIQEFLRKADRHVQLRAIKTLLGPCVALCSPVQLAKTILDDAAPAARRLFFEIINEIDGLVSSTKLNVLEDVRGRLESCEELLECWLHCLAHFGKLDKLSASQIRAVLENLVEIIKRSFEHCKTSEDAYGDLFEKAKERLTTLFRKTNELQKLFSVILERVIVFSNDVKVELTALAKVVKFTGETCLLVDGLDMKTMAESWKGFTRIAIAYCNDLKTFTPPCVMPHLASLADAISSSLPTTLKDADQKSAERSIKLQKLLLKIIHKLCIAYSGYLGNDAASAVLRLLVQLHRYSPCCLKVLNINLPVIECVEANFTSTIDQLLDSVINEVEFKQAFFEYQSVTQNSDFIGYHISTLFLINKLINYSSNETLINWRTHPHDILDIAFSNLSHLEEELFVGQLQLETLPLYDSTLTSICGLVISTRDVDFPSLEILLLKYLLGGNLWSSILASDVWCFVNKLSSADLSYDHLIYLMSVYEILMSRGSCMETVILGNLISRLYSLSSSETRNRLIDKFETNKARFWAPLKRFISHNDRTFLSELTCTDIGSVATTWETLDIKPSADIWTHLLNQLTVIGIFGKAQDESVLKTLTAIWNCLEKSSDEFEGIHLHLITKLIIVLLDATQALQNQDESVCPVLTNLMSLIPSGVSYLRASVSHYLKESIENCLKSSAEKTALLSKIYCNLLEDTNPLSQQEALESFAHVTNVSYDEELVIGIVDAVAEVPQISDIVSLYLSHTPSQTLRGFSSLYTYLTGFYEAYKKTASVHVCWERGETHREEKRRKLSIDGSMKRVSGTPEDLRERLNKLSEDVDYIFARKHDLSKSSLDKLEIVINKIICFNDV